MSLTPAQLQQLLLQYGITKLRSLTFPPPYPRDGLIAYADGVTWNPGSGVGPYIYLNGTWVFLAPGGGTGLPGGLNGQIQFNSGGTLGGLTNVQVTARIQQFTDVLSGAVPASGGGTLNFLRADGTFAPIVAGGITDGDKTDITVSGSGTIWTIDSNVVTFAKMQDILTDRLIGRDTAGNGDPEQLTVSGGLEFSGSIGIQRSALTGDVTAPAGSNATTIAAGAVQNSMLASGAVTTAKIFDDQVTFAKMQEINASRFIGRVTPGFGNPEELTGTQATTLLDPFTTSLKGVVPASGGGTRKFLRADGTWATAGDFVNIKDFGAVGDGVTDDTAAFVAFRTFAVDKYLTLIIPPGQYPAAGSDWTTGSKELFVWAYGATIDLYKTTGGITQTLTDTSLIASTTPGDTSVTLLTPAEASNYAVGDWVLVSSIEMQGANGFPPNFYNCEYKKIGGISGAVISFQANDPSFDSHIRYRHLSTYPDMGPGADAWAGGAARIFKMSQYWDQHLKIMGARIDVPAQIIAHSRKIELIDCTIVNNLGMAPTNTKDMIFDGCSMPELEIDKLIENLTFKNCVAAGFQMQSASVMNLTIDSCHISGNIGNCVRNITVRDSTIGNLFLFGEFGGAETNLFENCYIGGFGINPLNNYLDLSALSFANGAFFQTKSGGNQAFRQFAIPGAVGYFTGTDGNMGNPFVILNTREDATKIYMDTTLRALPTYSGFGSPVATRIVFHPARSITVTNCTGNQTILDLTQSAPGRPLYELGHAIFMQDTTGVNAWGTIVRLSINVLRAYTGVIGTYAAEVHIPIYNNNVRTFINDTINLKVVGERVYYPGSTIGAQAGDSLSTLAANSWLADYFSLVNFSGSITGETIDLWPIIEIEAQTDQGITRYGRLQTAQQLVW